MAKSSGFTEPSERLAPHSVEAEEATLGAIILNPDLFIELSSVIDGDDFYLLRHKWVWEAMEKIVERNEAIDNLSLMEELRAQGHLDEVGGGAYVSHLINNTPTSLHAETYAAIVERANIRRQLLNAASRIANYSTSPDIDIEEVLEQSFGAMQDIALSSVVNDIVSAEEAASQLFDEIHHLQSIPLDKRFLGHRTGLTDVDKILNGLKPDYAYCLGGKPGFGKTSLALHIAYRVATQEAPITIPRKIVFFASYEMSAKRLMARFAASLCNIDSERLRLGDLTDKEWGLFVKKIGELAKLPIYFVDARGYTIRRLRSRLEYMRQQFGEPGLVVIDHLHEIPADPNAKYDNRADEIANICRMVKSMTAPARNKHGRLVRYQYDCPVLLLAQYNRIGAKTNIPTMFDFLGSSGIEQSMDCVLHTFALPEDTHGTARVRIEKHRDGNITGQAGVQVAYHKNTYTWRDLYMVDIDDIIFNFGNDNEDEP